MFCPKCGTQLPDGAAFCGNCGSQLGTANAAPAYAVGGASAAMSPSPKKPGKKLIIGGAIAIVVVIALIVVFALVVPGCGKFNGASSPQEICTELTQKAQSRFKNGLSVQSIENYAFDDVYGMEPPDYLETMLKSQGLTEDYLKKQIENSLSSAFGVSGANSTDALDRILGQVEVNNVSFSLGDTISQSTMSSINEGFARMGYGKMVTSGFYVRQSYMVRTNEAVPSLGWKAGETKSENNSSSGLCVIQVDGKWYLYSSNY